MSDYNAVVIGAGDAGLTATTGNVSHNWGNEMKKLFNKRPSRRLLMATCAMTLAGSFSELALADIDEIIVTAQRREQSLSDVPVAVSAFSGENLAEMGIDRPGDLMNFTSGLSGLDDGTTFTGYAIRGITSNVFTIDSEASVGLFIDGMYIGRFGSGAGALFDVNRVEVLKGPQSTMFGRNSSAGAISIHTNKPDVDGNSATGAVRYGNFETRGADLVLNVPLSESTAVRFAGRMEDSDGYAHYAASGNKANDTSLRAMRGSLRSQMSENVVFDFSAEYEHSIFKAPYLPDDPLLPTGPFDRLLYGNVEAMHDVELWGVNGRFTVDLDNGYQLKTLTAYRTFDLVGPDDLDALPTDVFGFLYLTGNETFFQDVRLHRETANANMFVGASYWNEEAMGNSIASYNELDFFGAGLCGFFAGAFPNDCFDGVMHEELRQDGETTTYSVYGDFIYAINDRVNFSAGLRYSHEEKTMKNEIVAISIADGAALPTFAQVLTGAANLIGGGVVGVTNLEETFTSLQPRIALDFAVNDNHMIYANVGRGFKAGGFNLPFTSTPAEKVSFDEETSWSYELGLKSTVFEGRARWNTAAYYYEYDDYQDRVTLDGQVTPLVENAATVIGYGIETDFNAELSDSTDLIISGTWNSIEYDEYTDEIGCDPGPCIPVDFAGNRLPYVPEISFAIGLRNSANVGEWGVLNSFVSYTYNDDMFFNRENDDGESSTGLLSGRMALRPADANWSIGIYGANLLDEEYLNTRTTILGAQRATIGYPRTFGVEFKFEM